MKVSTTTPSGVRLYYQSAPTRFYKVGGLIVPSVTEVLGVLDKPALVWWGMKVGVEGVSALMEKAMRGEVESPLDIGDTERIVELLKEHKLTVNHIRDAGGDRGSAVHDAFERWAIDGELPDPEAYTDPDRGYVEGLVKFLVDARPKALRHEVMVGSPTHRYAGRYDLLADLPACNIVIRQAPVRQKRADIEAGTYLIDLKTSKAVYPTHHLQLAAYEGASRECGFPPSKARAVIRVGADGTYEFVQTPIPMFNEFIAVRAAHDAMQRVTKAKKGQA